MDVRDLRVFAAVAETGVVTRAANLLNTVQSNVTSRIRNLEVELGATLFVRHSRGMSLTSAGTQLLPYATRIMDLLDEAKRTIGDVDDPRGALRIGSMETTAAVRLPSMLASFGAQFPQVELHFQTGTSEALTNDVLDRKLHGAFVSGPLSHPHLETHVVFREELVVASALTIENLDEYLRDVGDVRILVFRQGCSYRKRFEALLLRRGIARVQVLEMGTLEGILGCAAAGLGITLLPMSVVGTGRMIAQHRLPQEEAVVETLFIKRIDVHAYPPLVQFAKRLTENTHLEGARSTLKSVA
jgi:DNA-binding transcriptional LysR family regulator